MSAVGAVGAAQPTAQPSGKASARQSRRTRITNRRNLELGLLVAAWLIGLYAYAEVDLAVLGKLPANLLAVAGLLAVLLGGAHIAIRILAPYADPVLVPIAALLNMLGLAMIHRLDLADAARAQRNGTKLPSADVISQLTWTTLALLLFAAILFTVRGPAVSPDQ